MWKRLCHEHVLQSHGVDKTNFQLTFIYGLEDFGNIVQCLDSNPKVSRSCAHLHHRLIVDPKLYSGSAGCQKAFVTSTLTRRWPSAFPAPFL